ASARRSGPRNNGIRPRRPRESTGLRPEVTSISPARLRTATDQLVGPWMSRPLRNAMPPNRSLGASACAPCWAWASSATEDPPGQLGEEVGRELHVGDGGELVGSVHERRGVEQVDLALGMEAVD